MIRTLARTAAGLTMGAVALGMMPAGATHAAPSYNADWSISTSCDGGFHWTLSFTNQGADSLTVELIASGGNYHREAVPGSTTVTWNVPDHEGFASTGQLLINDSWADEESTVGVVDCVTDGEVSASISLVCPAQGSVEDIHIDYEFSAPGTGAKFEFDTPDGGTDGLIAADEVTHRTRTVTQGQAVNVAIRDITDGEAVVATFNQTVDCPVTVVEEDTPSDGSEGSSGQLPETGNGATVAWFAAALTVLGAGALRASRRQAIAGE